MSGTDAGSFDITKGANLDRLRSLRGIKWSRYDGDMLSAWVADMDFEPAPMAVDAVQGIVDRRDFGYTRMAREALPDAWAAWQERRHGWSPDTDQLRFFTDVLHAIDIALWLWTEPGDGIVLFTPIYHPFLAAVNHGGRRLVDCPLDPEGWRLDPERLEASIDEGTKVILTCNPHNPSGRVFDRDELTAIAEVAERHDLLVLSDEIWADIVFPGSTHVPMANISPEAAARTVTISAASKAFNLAGLRTAVAHVGHTGVRDAIDELPSHALGGLSTPGLEATLACWTEGDGWLDGLVRHLTEQRNHLAVRLAEDVPGSRFQLPEATYLNFIDLSGCGLGDDPAPFIEQHGLAVNPGVAFGTNGEGHIRLNTATSREILDAMIDRIAAAVAAS